MNNGFAIILAIMMVGMVAGCSEKRDGVPVPITFSRFYYEKSGRQAAIGNVFEMKEGENVVAVVDPGVSLMDPGRDRLFHIDWIGPGNRSVYLKRIDLPAGDSTGKLVSAVSLDPLKRDAGVYSVRVYYFRDLIAEKQFEMVPEGTANHIEADIIFYKSLDKETGEMNGIDTVFEIRKKGILRARVNLRNMGIYEDDELPFRMEWYGPDGKSFYDKKMMVNPADTVVTLNGSVSITPDKRQPGDYELRVLLFDDIIVKRR
ncbi:MAG: hypothetical protein RBS55_00630, partial [Bacteroidales bacterium]|nr:hypothetical protein [Bacteroidales bacterium]